MSSLVDEFLHFAETNAMNKRLLSIAVRLFFDIVTAVDFPDFITTYLNDNLEFQLEQQDTMRIHSKL